MLPFLALLAAPPPPDSSAYWQQRVAYEIHASLDEPSGVLTGHVVIRYVNESPDTLRDFYVHQYLNAFRPGSRWSAVDSAEGRVRFQHLKDPDYAFERITAARVMETLGLPDYPYAPDSTIAHWPLARPLAPGDSLTAEIDWQARLSTVPRRQGREGRRFDFAQWYPKVTVYDRYGWEDHPLYPAGEFYGEFGTFDVTLDLPDDQVIGATGVPVCGDPGWERARAGPDVHVDYQRDVYGAVPHDCPPAAPGRKTVRFRAEQVHHFAFSLNPQYVYEQGRYGDAVVRVLYLPEDRDTWGRGIAVGRTETALAWLDAVYGPFAWPQITNVHRIEGGGTEFPMMVMNGGASLGLILHEVGHNYTMGILANNEWREGWLDEGFTSFQTGWFEETHGGAPAYPRLDAYMLFFDLDRWSQPVSMVSERYRDFPTYNAMIYTKAQLFYEELRYVVGDGVMRQILRTYYARWKLKHVEETAFRSVCEEVSHQDLGWLFGQWLHGTPLFDYRLAKAVRRRLPDGTWRTTVTIDRLGDGWMPVEIADRTRIYARATGQPEVERVSFTSAQRPGRLVLDPRERTHDWDMLNNAEPKGLFRDRALRQWRFDDPTHEVARRDRLVVGLAPVAWSNDAGGATIGLRTRTNYLGRYERRLFMATAATRSGASQRGGLFARVNDPVRHLVPRTESSVSAWWVEGRAGAALSVDRSLRRRQVDAADPHAGFDAVWMATTDLAYLDSRLWDDAGTVEAGPWLASSWTTGHTVWQARIGGHAGLAYRTPGQGLLTQNRYDVDAFVRGSAELSARRSFWGRTTLGVRAYAGGYTGGASPPRQRRIMVSGADPYETFTNPLLRSRGALLVRPGFHYHAPGGANLRGFAPQLGGRWALSVNLELVRPLLERGAGVVRRVAAELFADGGLVDTLAVPASTRGRSYTPLYDGGVGLVSTHAVGDLGWTMRFELPLVVNRWRYAADERSGLARLAFRWQVSLAPSF
jgi:hypothetical protein